MPPLSPAAPHLPALPRSTVGPAPYSQAGNEQTLVLQRKLGEGAYGDVYVGQEDRAVKVVRREHDDVSREKMEALGHEWNLLKRCERVGVPHVVHALGYQRKCHHVFREGKHALSPAAASSVAALSYDVLVTELAHNGSLEDKIRKKPLTEEEHRYLAACMLRSLDRMHRCAGVIHRDIKTENIVYEGKEPRLIDLGIASDKYRPTSAVGSPYFMAPDIFNATYENRAYTNKIDLWSLGVTLYRARTGLYPFRAQTAYGIYVAAQKHCEKRENLYFPLYMSPVEKRFILYLLQGEKTRPSAREALQHSFIQGMQSQPEAPLAAPAVAFRLPFLRGGFFRA